MSQTTLVRGRLAGYLENMAKVLRDEEAKTTAYVEVPTREQENMLSPMAGVYAAGHIAREVNSASARQRRAAKALWIVWVGPVAVLVIASAVATIVGLFTN